MWVDGKFATYSDFFHGASRFAVNGVYQPEYEGIDSFLLYTLSPDTTSSFKNVQVCAEKCVGTAEDIIFNGAFGRYGNGI